jgi:hypothetical protein
MPSQSALIEKEVRIADVTGAVGKHDVCGTEAVEGVHCGGNDKRVSVDGRFGRTAAEARDDESGTE